MGDLFKRSLTRKAFVALLKDGVPQRFQTDVNKLLDSIVFKNELEDYMNAEESTTIASNKFEEKFPQSSHTDLLDIGTNTHPQIDSFISRDRQYSSKTANYTVVLTDKHIDVDSSGGAITISLPSASSAAGLDFHISEVGTSSAGFTISPNGSDLIDNDSSLIVNYPGDSVHIYSNGTGWVIL